MLAQHISPDRDSLPKRDTQKQLLIFFPAARVVVTCANPLPRVAVTCANPLARRLLSVSNSFWSKIKTRASAQMPQVDL
jgi:hypothetical protein